MVEIPVQYELHSPSPRAGFRSDFSQIGNVGSKDAFSVPGVYCCASYVGLDSPSTLIVKHLLRLLRTRYIKEAFSALPKMMKRTSLPRVSYRLILH